MELIAATVALHLEHEHITDSEELRDALFSKSESTFEQGREQVPVGLELISPTHPQAHA